MEIDNRYGFLFDLDGVLIDSEKEYSRIWATVNSEFPSGVDDLQNKIKGCTLDKILADYFPDPHVQQHVVKRLYDLEGQMHYVYTPGAEALLQKLKESGLSTALVTSSNDDKMRHLDEELPDIRSFFDVIVTADLISKSKPDPEGYLKASYMLGLDISDCIVFEDSLQGVKAGKAAGAYVVGVAGTLSEESLRPYSDIVIETLTGLDIRTLIEKVKEKHIKYGRD